MCHQFQRLLAAALILFFTLQSCNLDRNLASIQVSELLTEDSKNSSASLELSGNTPKNYLTETNLTLHPIPQVFLESHSININSLSYRSLTPLEEECKVLQKSDTWKMNNTLLEASTVKVLPIYARQEDGSLRSVGNQKGCLKPHISRLYDNKEQKLSVGWVRVYKELKEEQKSKKQQSELSLHQAAQQGDIKVFKQIVDRVIDSHRRDIDGYTPLHYAAKHGHLEIVHFLLTKKGADPNIGDCYGSTALHLAAANGHLDIVALLLKNHADPNKTEQLYGYTPLHYATEHGHVDIIQLLLNNRAYCKVTKAGFTPLHVAARKPYIAAVELLLNSKNVNFANKNNGYTPLHVAARHGHLAIVTLLLDRGANSNKKAHSDGTTPLCIAVKHGHVQVVQLLLDRGAKPNRANDHGITPLHLAAEHGHVAIVNLLLERGAKPNAAKRDGTTPLTIAAKHGYCQVVELLLNNGAEPNKAKLDGNTPLCTVVEYGHLEVVKLLLARGANPNQANNQGYTPLHIVAEKSICLTPTALPSMQGPVSSSWYRQNKHLNNVAEIIYALLEAGAELNAQNKNGDTFLHTIVARKKIDLFIRTMLTITTSNAYLLSLLQDCSMCSELSANDIFPIILAFVQEVNWNLKNKQGKTIKNLIQEISGNQKEYEKILQALKVKVE